jgi:putative restriction endonuclease
MPIRLVVAVTDRDWFEYLRVKPNLTEVNFWAPGAAPFKALQPGELFLFKLHSPFNFIVGGGVFAYPNTVPCSLAWEAFGDSNGAPSFAAMRTRIAKYRKADRADKTDFLIGCRILTQPFFLSQDEWITVPETWSPNIVTFKTYDTSNAAGTALWAAIEERLRGKNGPLNSDLQRERYGTPILVRPRLGQGAFRVMVTDAYNRKCAITGERTLPALEAAHIKPFAIGGSHNPQNGLLLRRDLHALFDTGYVTVTPDFEFHVSGKIKEEFENGRHYYALNGQRITTPALSNWTPDPAALKWHNEECFRG